VQTGSDTTSYSVSTSKWYNPSSWGNSETITETTYYKYANVYDTVEQIEEFVKDSEQNISKTVENIIDIKIFRKDIMASVLGLFDVADDDFDPSDIIDTLKNSVNRISIPSVDIDTSAHIDKVRESFSVSEVKDSQIDSLKNEVKRVLALILDAMKDEIVAQTSKIIKELNDAKDNFLPKLLQDSIQKLENMKQKRVKLEETEAEYKKLLDILQHQGAVNKL